MDCLRDRPPQQSAPKPPWASMPWLLQTLPCQGLQLHLWLVEAVDGKRCYVPVCRERLQNWVHSEDLGSLRRKEEAQERILRGHQIHSLVPLQDLALKGLVQWGQTTNRTGRAHLFPWEVAGSSYNSAHMLCLLLNFLKCCFTEKNGFHKLHS